jgi:hypothetical protein
MKALSIRQPWAWLILHGGKDIENRTWRTNYRGPVMIHAGKTMTKADYEAACIFCNSMGLPISDNPDDWTFFPTFEELKKQCGGIVGSVEIVDCVSFSVSPWFTGDFGFVLKNAEPLPFMPRKGALSFFEV